MIIKNMFRSDINRSINGVIKVGQGDSKVIDQEIREYIVTKELHRHYRTFFENYAKAFEIQTDNIGVWISGFFGSGKSHFLKMLSYMLCNQDIDGKRVIGYFKEKFEGSELYETIKKSTETVTESILFNIDIEGPLNKDRTAVLRVFAKVFYNHIGLYGDDLKIAQLERFLDKQGKTNAFHDRFNEINGASWLETRSSYAFFEDDIVSVLQDVLDMSEVAARNWFNKEESDNLSIKQLVEEIKSYVDSRGDGFRLLFCVDEVGQYIGEDGDLMINLQSIVEEIGSKCCGKVWVIVTSQEAIDSVVKIQGDDFSKIQGRFNTRLSLSSASVDEVIKKRILAKTDDADIHLQLVYEKEHAVLKNLFSFNDAVLDVKGYSDAIEFSSAYPFVPYQFIIIQKVLAEIRKHGNSGKHLSGGERSMLSGFQEAAQRIQLKDENALAPFSLFYDTVHTFLESSIRRVIDRCQTAADNRNGLEQQDVSVLKLLYLIRYIDDIKANIDNIAILMIDDIRIDKIELRKKVADSLTRLEAQNYVARNGDNYAFLTDEEQDVAIDIRNTTVDSGVIVQTIGQAIFDEIYPTKRYKLGKYDFTYDRYIDDTVVGAFTGGIRLRFVTEVSEYYNMSENKMITDSMVNKEVIVLMSKEAQYYEELETAAKIRKYIRQRNVTQLPESIQTIIRSRRDAARKLEERAKIEIEKAIVDGRYFVYGEKLELRHPGAKNKLDEALKRLIESVYSKLRVIDEFIENDEEIMQILNMEQNRHNNPGEGEVNGSGQEEISQWLEDRHINKSSVTMGDVYRRYQAAPYGWREIDIAALVARLIVARKVEVRYSGVVIGKADQKLIRYLRVKSEQDKVEISRRIIPSEEQIRKSKSFLREWLGQTGIPEDENELIEFIETILEKKQSHYVELIHEYDRIRYPQKEVVVTARDLIKEILSRKNDSVSFLACLLNRQDELLDTSEDMEEIEMFFETQREVYDEAWQMLSNLQNERVYFMANRETLSRINEISEILGMQKPYSRIRDLTELMEGVEKEYESLLGQKKEEVGGIIIQCMGDIHTLAEVGREVTEEVRKADERFTEYKTKTTEAQSLTVLDAMITQLLNYKDLVCKQIEAIQVPVTQNRTGEETKRRKAVQMRRYEVFPVKRLSTREDVDGYLEVIRQKLYGALDVNDSIQIN